MKTVKHIALVAHDNRKKDLIEWVQWNYTSLIKHKLICTGTTGNMVQEALHEKVIGESDTFEIVKLKSGPLGGDQQLGSMIVEGRIDCIIFLWDPMTLMSRLCCALPCFTTSPLHAIARQLTLSFHPP